MPSTTLHNVGTKRIPRPKLELSRPLYDEPSRLRSRWLHMVGNTSSFGMVTEYLRGSLGDMIHFFHVGAICQLLKCRWARGRFEELDSLLIRAISGEEVLRAINAGEPSLLEDLPHLCTPEKLEMAEAGEPEAISDVILSQFCRLPRLIALTRTCADQPGDRYSADRALVSAEMIYDFRIEPLPFNTRERLASDKDYVSDLNDSVLDSWFDFESVFDFVVTLRYYSIRAMICGIIGPLAELGLATNNDFNLEAVANEELIAAENIVKCCRYALHPAWKPAWPALRLPTALKISYGAWNRLLQGRSQAKSSAATRERAASMKDFCARVSARIGQVWYGWNVYPRLDDFSETCVGGPRLTEQRSPASAIMNHALR